MVRGKEIRYRCSAAIAAVLLLGIALCTDAAAGRVLSINVSPDESRGPLGLLQGINSHWGFVSDTGYRHPPDEWKFWAASGWTQTARAFIERDPVPCVVVRMGNAGEWSLGLVNPVQVEPNQKWTFTAVVGGRKWDWLGNNTACAGIVGLNSSGEVVNWIVGSHCETGDFGWKRVHVTVTVPPGITQLQPRFFGSGGGEFFAAAADISQGASPAELTVPSENLPQSVSHLKLIVPNRPEGIYEPGNQVTWRVGVWGSGSATFPYRITNGYGQQVSSGEVAVGGTVNFTPTTPGYYELQTGNDLRPDLSARYCSGIDGIAVLPKSTDWSPGCNPFGLNTITFAPGTHRYSPWIEHLGISWERGCYQNIVTGNWALPTDLNEFADAYEAKVRAGLHPNSIETIEVWNEPNNGIPGEWTIEQFLDTVKAARAGARRANPNVKIAVNFEHVRELGRPIKAFDTFYKAGAKGNYDIMTIHPYMGGTWARPVVPQSPEDGNMIWWAQEARKLLNEVGDDQVEVWSTEYGWPVLPSGPHPCSDMDQARFIVRGALLQLACGMKRVCAFMIEDIAGWDEWNGTFGLVRAVGGPRPSLVAYSVLAQTVGNLPFVGWADFGPDKGVFLFGNADRTVAVLWHPSATRTLSLKIPTSAATLVGFFGDRNVIDNANQSAYNCRIGPSPVYIEMDTSPQAVASSFGVALRTEIPENLFKTKDTEAASGIEHTGLLARTWGKMR